MANVTIDINITNDENRAWIYKDMHENLALDPVKREISSYYNAGAIQNSLLNLFRFKKGERLALPEYGLNLEEFLYEQINTTTARAIGESIKSGFERWEPRISFSGVNVAPDIENNTYHVLISYTIPLLGGDEYEMAYVLNKG